MGHIQLLERPQVSPLKSYQKRNVLQTLESIDP